MVCQAFNIDPIAAIAEGSLLITARSTHSGKIIEKLKGIHIDASITGKVTGNKENRIIRRLDGNKVSLAIPEQDPFWPVFFEGLRQS
jgi:hydrogenase maturation factor